MTSDAQPYWDDCSTRDAVAMSGTNIGDELNAADVSLGLVRGRLPAHDRFAVRRPRRHAGQATATFMPDEFKNAGSKRRCRTPPTRASATRCTPWASQVGGTGQYGFKDDYIPHHEPFEYYASTANPHHLTLPTDGGATTPAALASIGTDTQHYVNGAKFDTAEPPVRHERLRPARGRHPAAQLPPDQPARGQLPQGTRLPGRSRRLLRPARRATASSSRRSTRWSAPRTGAAPPSSSATTTPTAGTTTPTAASPTRRSPSPTRSPVRPCGSGRSLAGQQGRCGYGPRLPLLVDLTVGAGRLCRPHPHRPVVDHPLHRRQLGRRPDPRELRRRRRTAQQPLRLPRHLRPPDQLPPVAPQPGDRSTPLRVAGRLLAETSLSVVSPGGVDTGDEDVGERTNRGPVMSTMELHAPRPSLGEPLHRVLAGLRPVLQRALTRELARHAVAAVAGPVVARRSPVSRDLTGAGGSRAPRGLGPRSGPDRTARCTGVARHASLA